MPRRERERELARRRKRKKERRKLRMKGLLSPSADATTKKGAVKEVAKKKKVVPKEAPQGPPEG